MLAKRIIPCLDVQNGRTVKGVNFVGLQDAGDPVELAAKYSQEGADELVFLDISATNEGRGTTVNLVKEVARVLTIPFTIGGGIRSVADAEVLLSAGADKISINSAAFRNPQLISDLADAFGSQFVVVAVDTKSVMVDNAVSSPAEVLENRVHLNGGTFQTSVKTEDWILEAQSLGAGEILLTSMDFDGVKSGFDLPLLYEVNQKLTIPLIASGGAGNIQHFVDVFKRANVDAALAASVFHFGEINISDLKQELDKQGICVRL